MVLRYRRCMAGEFSFRFARHLTSICNLDDAAVHPVLQSGESDRRACVRSLPLHKPFGVQSWTIVVAGCDDLWRMITIERRRSVPRAVRCIDNPMGTTTGRPPTRLICMRPLELSRHVLPATAYQASGPEWMCAG